tara:strand:- start:30 stop:323 length:294 start_codon:yes stop_codon:yes gene_type:complete
MADTDGKVVELNPDGSLIQVREPTVAEKADLENTLAKELLRIRMSRNELLQQTDWMANSDVTMTDAWKTYRQELRNLTNGLDTLNKALTVTWPTKPS